MKIINKKNLTIIFLIFMIISSFLDLHIFYNSYSTLFRVIFLAIFFIFSFFLYSNKKERITIVSYFIISFIYIFLHIFFSGDNLIKELVYFLKMNSSLFTFYTVYKLEISYDKSIKVIKFILLFISGSILFCNIFKIGYSSYSFDIIKYNIIDWFKNGNGEKYFEYYSGKGYFHFANQIVGVVLLFFPLLINELKVNSKVNDFILVNLVAISMLIVGNRAASMGPLLIMICSLIIYLFLVFIKVEKINIKFIFMLLFSIILTNVFLFNSPLLSREKYYDNLVSDNVYDSVINDSMVNNDKLDDDNHNNLPSDDNKLTTRDILLSYDLNSNFIDLYYPYENDMEFWDNLVKMNIHFEDSRLIEKLVINRVYNMSNARGKLFFGIGYNSAINIVNIERDYVMQYYTIGILGIILFLGIYFVFYFLLGFKILFNLENQLNFLNLMFLLSILIELFLAYFSGNMLNAISSIISLSFILGVFYNRVNIKESDNVKILGFNVSKLSEDAIINEINKSNECNVLFNINPLIMCNFYKNYKVKEFINKQKYNIVDGYGTILGFKLKGDNSYKQITGIDMFDRLIKNSIKENKRIYLYGTKNEIINKTVKNLRKKYKKVNICGFNDGYIDSDIVLADIVKKKPDYIFVGLGSPKQEMFIFDNCEDLSFANVIMPVGGTFDVISGFKSRAPLLFQKFHLEWLYRMVKEPRRIRDNIKIIKYLYLVLFRNNCYNEGGDKSEIVE